MISRRVRFEVLKRDGFRCRYCGAEAPATKLHVDHVLAVANGGSDDPANLVAACRDCNLGKQDVPLDEGQRSTASAARAARRKTLQPYQIRDIASMAGAHPDTVRDELANPGEVDNVRRERIRRAIKLWRKQHNDPRPVDSGYIAPDDWRIAASYG